MVTAKQWCALALSMPEAEQKAHFGNPDFRVRNKIFAGMDAAGKRGNLKLTPEAQAALLEARADAFHPAAGAWGQRGWTHVVLAEARLDELRSLMHDAWRAVAPNSLLSGHAAAPTASDAAPPAPRSRGGSRKRAAKTR